MNIQHNQRGTMGLFFIDEEGKRVAKMNYEKTEGKINIVHTEVDESMQGQQVGQKLVKEGVEYARQNNLKIAATCSFAHAILAKDESFKDVFEL